ncbi:MAG: hypothetical protein M3Y28_11805, partial [Armatimonadota bacterium]|nr:hypothetical protein [Armatimonadota bacterium]
MSDFSSVAGFISQQIENFTMGTRPSLIQLGGEENFILYQQEFQRLYQTESVMDVLGNEVEFSQSACRHVCFKGDT